MKNISQALKYSALINHHLSNNISITNSFLRMGSDSWCDLVCYYRNYNKEDRSYSSNDNVIVNKLETGKKAYYKENGSWKIVKLDLPEVHVHNGKRFRVFRSTSRMHEDLPVAKVIRFGSADSNLQIKNDDKTRSDSFWARHKCDLKKDKNTPGWWACYAPELFGDILKLKGGKTRW